MSAVAAKRREQGIFTLDTPDGCWERLHPSIRSLSSYKATLEAKGLCKLLPYGHKIALLKIMLTDARSRSFDYAVLRSDGMKEGVPSWYVL